VDFDHLEKWFRERPKWLQDAGRRLVQKGTLTEKDIEELFALCVAEGACQEVNFCGLPACCLDVVEAKRVLRLESIADIQGINKLTPSKPLEFGKAQLCIVYGRNGAGKSGYVRLLKHACGARRPGELLGNIFKADAEPQTAKFTFTEDLQTKTSEWNGHSLPELQGVEIYDTACGLIYINDENEVAYEPWLLRFFRLLTEACTKLTQQVQENIARHVSKKPAIPPELASTSAADWYAKLSASTSVNNVDERTAWEVEHHARFDEVNARLAEPNPSARAAVLRRQKILILELKRDLKEIYDGLSDERCNTYLRSRADAEAKRKAADEDAHKVFGKAPLSGVGSQSWRLLWDAARRYSEEHAYPAMPFPNVAEDALCVLCQRAIDPESRDRFISFETFVKGELLSLASEAERNLYECLQSLPELPSREILDIKLEAGAVTDESVKAQVADFSITLNNRKKACLEATSMAEIPERPHKTPLINLVQTARRYAALARAYDKDAHGQNRPQLEDEARELSARKWLHEQRSAIDMEISRLIAIQLLHEADRLTNTQALSKRKSVLAQELITDAYIERFEKELARLKASRIAVELKKTKADVGRVYHRIFLKNATSLTKTSEILSEGEFRIISLAAFLADTEGRGSRTPFIFDDPISSLDHVYEEATAKRLAQLSQARQVIVFTHRLSLVGFLEKYAEKYNINTELLCLSRYVTGEIADLPIDLKRTDRAVNELANARLAAARKALAQQGDEGYEKEAKALCRDIRTLMERVVETDLLNEVLKRYSPEINTKGRIHSLANITRADCEFIDEYMTKYSRYEHSQPDEAPVELPMPDEIDSDLKNISKFIESIRKRNRGIA
jgi:energy-coupling factor transporter ATP-binding protein EcfA2